MSHIAGLIQIFDFIMSVVLNAFFPNKHSIVHKFNVLVCKREIHWQDNIYIIYSTICLLALSAVNCSRACFAIHYTHSCMPSAPSWACSGSPLQCWASAWQLPAAPHASIDDTSGLADRIINCTYYYVVAIAMDIYIYSAEIYCQWGRLFRMGWSIRKYLGCIIRARICKV